MSELFYENEKIYLENIENIRKLLEKSSSEKSNQIFDQANFILTKTEQLVMVFPDIIPI